MTRAQVSVDGEVLGAIGAGLLVLIGVTHGDDSATARKMAGKLWHLRIMADEGGTMNRSIADTTRSALVVSQFTLYGDTGAGRRPSWLAAAGGAVAEPVVAEVVAELRRLGAVVATGRFGADMAVELINDGPVTVLVEV